MAIRVALHHKTSYHYDRLVSLSPHEVRLYGFNRPASAAISVNGTGLQALQGGRCPTPWW